jgi:Rps23 Pro-64 3,4-dihydroxylase Tpa1-like proline 4-hydroxylase
MTEITQDSLVELIVGRLSAELSALQSAYKPQTAAVRTHACSIPDLLPEDIARRIHAGFPPVTAMRRMVSMREHKYTLKTLRQCDPIVEQATFAFQDPRVVTLIERLTGMRDLIPDSRLYAGGISSMVRGDYLHPHIDNSHDSDRKLYRRINLLYYVTPGWELANGGHLHLWCPRVREAVRLPSAFNTLVLMETNRYSWHSVDTVLADGPRCCVSNYYFSQRSPDGSEYFHVTDFSAPPDKPFQRLIARADGRLRMAVRLVKRSGLSRRDYYR